MLSALPDARQILSHLADYVPFLAIVAGTAVALFLIDRLLRRRAEKMSREMFLRQILMFVLTGTAVVVAVVALPVDPKTRSDLLGILGLVFTGIIGLSSTSFVSNAMAGLMLRAVRCFRPGDFIRAGEQFGRVTERGLFHTEIQTEDRDLTTIPNLYLVTNPVTVVHSTGTIVSCHVSLGYDIPNDRLEPLFLQAAAKAGLEDPFVQILELGNFAVTYRVAGGLVEVKHILTARSRIRKHVLDTLHGAGIEIMSPSYMVQRPQPDPQPAIPPASHPHKQETPSPPPEERIFDKAEVAANLEDLKTERSRLTTEIEGFKKSLGESAKEQRPEIKDAITRHENRISKITEVLTTDESSDPAP